MLCLSTVFLARFPYERFVIASCMQEHVHTQMAVHIRVSANFPSHHCPSPTNNCEAFNQFQPNLAAEQRFLTHLFPTGLYKQAVN